MVQRNIAVSLCYGTGNGLSSYFASLMKNKAYFITQLSHTELVLFKIQNLCAFCLISSILKFKCILKTTVAKKPWQDSDLHAKYLIENNLWLNWKIVSSSLHFSILIRFWLLLFQIHFSTKKYKRDTAPEKALHQPSPTEQRAQHNRAHTAHELHYTYNIRWNHSNVLSPWWISKELNGGC